MKISFKQIMNINLKDGLNIYNFYIENSLKIRN